MHFTKMHGLGNDYVYGDHFSGSSSEDTSPCRTVHLPAAIIFMPSRKPMVHYFSHCPPGRHPLCLAHVLIDSISPYKLPGRTILSHDPVF